MKPGVSLYFHLERTIITLTQICARENPMRVRIQYAWESHAGENPMRNMRNCYWANPNWVEDIKLVWKNLMGQNGFFLKIHLNKGAYSWCPYHNILPFQMYIIQNYITLHSSLLILQPPFFTLHPTPSVPPFFTLHPLTFSLASKKPSLFIVMFHAINHLQVSYC